MNAENGADRRVNNLYSFLHGRDTSINIQRPRPIMQLNLDARISDVLYEDSSSNDGCSSVASAAASLEIPEHEETQVFLRIRPIETHLNRWGYSFEGNHFHVETNPGEKIYKFTNIFDCFVSQKELFKNTVQPLLSKFEGGSILCYGTSSSGKTFTLHGTPSNPGIVPRALHQIFKELGPTISATPVLKLIDGEPTFLPDDSVIYEEKVTNYLLSAAAPKLEDFEKMKLTIKRDCAVFDVPNVEGSNCINYMWVSFAEIYNECVYDLLTLDGLEDNNKENEMKQKNQRLRIISNDGHAYIKDLTSIFVQNEDEAYTVLQIGLNRVSNATTKVNLSSTRSHCIFFVDIIKYMYTATDCTLCSYGYKFCDLAGSERLKKTENIGIRLAEAKNINKSLLTLGRCLSVSHERQRNKRKDLVIPFRESKLTTLLQCALQGNEKLALFVNIAPRLDFAEENLNVLNFSAIAREITRVIPKKNQNKSKRTTRYSFAMSNIGSPQRRPLTSTDMYMHDLQQENCELKQEVAELKKELIRQEIDLRKTLCEAFGNDYNTQEESNAKRIEHFQKRIDKYEVEVQELNQTIIDLKYSNFDLEDEVVDLKQEIVKLNDELANLKTS